MIRGSSRTQREISMSTQYILTQDSLRTFSNPSLGICQEIHPNICLRQCPSQPKSPRPSFRSFLCPRATLLPQFLCLRIWPHWKLTKKDTQIIGVWIWTWNVVDADTQRWRLVAIRENIVPALGKRSVPILPEASTGMIRTAPCDEFLR